MTKQESQSKLEEPQEAELQDSTLSTVSGARRYLPEQHMSVKEIHRLPNGNLDTAFLSLKQIRYIRALKKNYGIVGEACKAASVTRDRYKFWMKNNKTFAAFVSNVEEDVEDYVKAQLMAKVTKGTTHAILSFLKARSKDYSDKVQVSGKLELSPSWYEQTKEGKEEIKEKKQEALDDSVQPKSLPEGNPS
jgi:hypothetical protein